MEQLKKTPSPPSTADAPEYQDAPRAIEDLLRQLGPAAVFGEPVRSGDATVIPVAEVRVGFGFGSGAGRGPGPEGGSGSGVGGGGKVIPRGYILVTPAGARFESALDVTAIALGAMALAATSVLALSRLLR